MRISRVIYGISVWTLIVLPPILIAAIVAFSKQEERKCAIYAERTQRPVQFIDWVLCKEQLADGTWAAVPYWKE